MDSIKLVSDDNNKIVTRRNDLIEARYKLSVQEQRLMYWVMSCIEPHEDDFKTYRVSISELAKTVGGNNKDFYSRLRAVTKKVMGRVIEMQDGENLIQMPLINKAKYNTGEGTVDIRLDEDLKRYLLQLRDNFTSVRVKYIFALSSSYAMRIYELLVQYQKIGERTISVADLRVMLDMEEGKYDRWDNFETYVLKIADKEINEKTDIKFKYEKIKKGRSIHAIKFTIRKNKKQNAPSTKTLSSDDTESLIKQGVAKKTAVKLVKNHPERIKNALLRLSKEKDVRNPAGWLIKAIEDDHQDTELFEKKKMEKVDKQRRKNNLIMEKAQQEEKAQSRKYSEYERTLIEEYLNTLTTEQEKDFTTVYLDRYPPLFPSHKKQKDREVLLSVVNRSTVIEYIQNETNVKFKSKEDILN